MRGKLLIVPGLGGAGPEHWQSLWATRHSGARLVAQRDWDAPVLSEWASTLETAVRGAGAPVIVVAHSLACSLVAHWARGGSVRAVSGALLVCPADVDSSAHTPEVTRPFAPMPLDPLPFRTVVVASANDPYVDLTRARHFARCWQAEFVDAGRRGHINVDAGHGEWPMGERLLADLAAGI